MSPYNLFGGFKFFAQFTFIFVVSFQSRFIFSVDLLFPSKIKRKQCHWSIVLHHDPDRVMLRLCCTLLFVACVEMHF